MTAGRRSFRKVLPFLILADVIIVAGVGWWVYAEMFSLPRRFAAVEDGILYRSGQGSKREIRNAIDQHGIKTIICLRRAREGENANWLAAEKDAADKAGVELKLWTTKSGEPLHEGFWLKFLKLTQDPSRRPVWIHCAQGRHRAGFVAALYRMVINEWPLDRALREMESFGFDLNTHANLIKALKKLKPDKIRAELKVETTQPTK